MATNQKAFGFADNTCTEARMGIITKDEMKVIKAFCKREGVPLEKALRWVSERVSVPVTLSPDAREAIFDSRKDKVWFDMSGHR